MAIELKDLNNYKSSMSEYLSFNIHLANQDILDPISYDKIYLLDSTSHPRSSMTLLRDNNKPYIYNVNTIINIIEIGNGCDPFTRKKYDEITIERAYLYKKCMDVFPDLKRDIIDYNEIYNEWINDVYHPFKLLKAQCLLQPSNIINNFRSYNGKNNTNNRADCIRELTNKPNNSWILRNSSIKDTEIQKAYCLSIKKKDKIYHYLIIHKIGYGIYFGVMCNSSKILDDSEELNYSKMYPSIVHLIQEQIY